MGVTAKLVRLYRVDQQLRGLSGRLRTAEAYLKEQERILGELDAKSGAIGAQLKLLEASAHNDEVEAKGFDQKIETWLRVHVEAFAELRGAPHTIVPDRLAASKKAVKIQTVGDKGVLTDGTRTIELHRLQGYEHAGDMLVVYLPADKILAEPDAFTPPPQAGTPLIPPAVPYAKALYDNIQRLKLDVKTIAGLHGNRLGDMAELARAAGVRLSSPTPHASAIASARSTVQGSPAAGRSSSPESNAASRRAASLTVARPSFPSCPSAFALRRGVLMCDRWRRRRSSLPGTYGPRRDRRQ